VESRPVRVPTVRAGDACDHERVTRTAIVGCFAILAACGGGDPETEDASVRQAPDALVAPDAWDGRCAWGGGCTIGGNDCPAGRACLPGASATECRPDGSAITGESCTTNADCAGSAVCVTHHDGTQSCRPLACDPRDCPSGPASLPNPEERLFSIEAPIAVGFCDASWCTALPADSCADGYSCNLMVDSWMLCEPTGLLGEGETCRDQECAAGLSCRVTCRRYCHADSDCATSCEILVPGLGLGLCR